MDPLNSSSDALQSLPLESPNVDLGDVFDFDDTTNALEKNGLYVPQSGMKCPLNALGPGSGSFKATCDVTNKINIDKYFELMKEEFSNPNSPTMVKPPTRSPRKVLSRSASSSTIEPIPQSNNDSIPLSPRRKKNAKKRISCDEKSLSMLAARNSLPARKGDCYFNYDLSGQIIKSDNRSDHHYNLAKQKSWDLSRSKERDEDDDNNISDLSLSYTSGDFRKLKDENNNNQNQVIKPSKSCETISSLGERHKEYAMMQGKIGSVSEENRKRRRKLYRKSRRGSEDRPHSMGEDSIGRINHLLMEKLVIDVG